MPLLKLQTSTPVSEDKKENLLKALSRTVVKVTGKPESYVMVMLENCSACMAGEAGPAAFADVRGIGGISRDANNQLSKDICELINKELGIEPDRIYLNFTDVNASNWGWKGGTFG
jgi:phenylpyruvate tautomerase PptA (4-oxalocrotonate tautomerase family)